MASESTVTLESGLRLSYAHQGASSDPVVVMLPGPTDSWRSYQPFSIGCRQTSQVIAVSQRGHGDSDKPQVGYSVEDLAADVVPLHYDDMADLKRITAPTLLLWGDSDELVSRDMQDQLLSHIPGANLLVYPGIGHTPRWECPSRFSKDRWPSPASTDHFADSPRMSAVPRRAFSRAEFSDAREWRRDDS